jgi:mRNA-degrading endonuclease RelE of RelBE toxin-antitoxin system
MPAAQQVYYPAFDKVFFSLSAENQRRIQSGIDAVGLHLESSPHYRMSGSDDFRLRVDDFRVIYYFDLPKNILYLWNLGHRSSVYRPRG